MYRTGGQRREASGWERGVKRDSKARRGLALGLREQLFGAGLQIVCAAERASARLACTAVWKASGVWLPCLARLLYISRAQQGGAQHHPCAAAPPDMVLGTIMI